MHRTATRHTFCFPYAHTSPLSSLLTATEQQNYHNQHDNGLLLFLHKLGIPWQVVLTKGDLLSPRKLAASLEVVRSDLQDLLRQKQQKVMKDGEESRQNARAIRSSSKSVESSESSGGSSACPSVRTSSLPPWSVVAVSANTGAGVQDLWQSLEQAAYAATAAPPSHISATSSFVSSSSSSSTSMESAQEEQAWGQGHRKKGPQMQMHTAVREHSLAALLRREAAALVARTSRTRSLSNPIRPKGLVKTH